MITLTVGGNDLMKVISSNIFDLKVSSFNRPQKAYQRRVRRLLEEIREYNEKAPIYVFRNLQSLLLKLFRNYRNARNR